VTGRDAVDPVDAVDAVERSLAAVAEWEPQVHAFAYLDADRARREARAVARDGPLVGVVLGVKDLFDTADQPTEYGSTIYAGHRPRADAGAVAQLRAAGAVALGKTVTAELGFYTPGATRNPHRTTHTPGGSSSGSAAAVASGMVDVALGTQTAGSVIRPASFCGVFGFKPTFGTVSGVGVKPAAPSLDTVGWFARDVEPLDRVRVVLTGRRAASHLDTPPRLAIVRTRQWLDATDDAHDAVDRAADAASDAGAAVTGLTLPTKFEGLASEHPTVMLYEARRSLAWEWAAHREQLSPALQRLLEQADAVDPDEYDNVVARATVARAACGDELFGGADVILTLATAGEAPEGIDSTGDPRFARMWTLLGLPTIAVPCGTGTTGLPVSVQLVARHRADARLLACAAWLGHALPTAPAPLL
jgi:Asp-tRNA(Asn)/Glu-tRNA(Gln) amidotransferase A subunit family amidase